MFFYDDKKNAIQFERFNSTLIACFICWSIFLYLNKFSKIIKF